MSKAKKFFRSPLMTGILALLAVGLLLTGSIGGTRAALQVFSDDYKSEVQLSGIGLELVENGTTVSDGGKLMQDLLERSDDTTIKIGKKYEEKLAVRNSGAIDQYVRVTIYKYWVDEKGNKMQNMDPSLISLDLSTSGWTEDTAAGTAERTVLNRSAILPSGAESTFCTGVTIKGDLSKAVKITTEGDTTIYTYAYDGASFTIEVVADAVQTHSGTAAITSAWGHA